MDSWCVMGGRRRWRDTGSALVTMGMDVHEVTYSPVIRTKASMPAHNSLSAVTGVRVNTSILLGDGGEVSQSSLDGGEMARPASADGFGGGGMMKVSAESCTDSVSMYV